MLAGAAHRNRLINLTANDRRRVSGAGPGKPVRRRRPGVQMVHPGKPQVLDIALIDLCQRTETPAGIVSGVSGPRIRRWLGQQLRVEPLC